MAELPVRTAAMNLVMAIARLPTMAAMMAVLDSLQMNRLKIKSVVYRVASYFAVFLYAKPN
jgi:hypothetical protein